MEHSENQPGSAADERLRALEERLSRASAAAERLMAQAAEAAASRKAAGPAAGPAAEPEAKPPPAGWEAPRDKHDRDAAGGDLELLVQVVESLRELIPPELQRRLAEALREVLLAVRALIDWYLERAERGPREPADVQDIPIL